MPTTSSSPIEILITIALPDALIEQIQSVSPRLHVNMKPARKPEEIPNEDWASAEILFTDRVIPAPAQVPVLHWVQFYFAGIDFVLGSPLLQKSELLVTTLSGAAAPQMAEFALTLLLALGHHLPDLSVNQSRAEWPRDRMERFSPSELRGSVVGIVGYGSVGRELARLLQPFNVTVLAIKREVMRPGDSGYMPEGLGDPQGDLFSRLYPVQALHSMLKECDFVIVALPLTNDTRHLIGEEELKVMKPTSYIVDVGRGDVIDPAALLTALQDHKIAGAAMDVFAEEPLPPNSPYWKMPNMIVSPHIGGMSAFYKERAVAMFTENLSRYILGDPLLNRFDPEKGY